MYDETIEIAAVGDIMLGDRPLMVGLGVRSSIESSCFYDPFAEVSTFLKKHDIVFGNLETVISDCGIQEKNFKSLQMRGANGSIILLKKAGFNVLSVANNHVMQHGEGAFHETVEFIHNNDILPIGCLDSDSNPLPRFLKIKETVIGFVGFSMRPEKYAITANYALADFKSILRCVKEYRKNCDFLIVSLHWGDEYVCCPSKEQIRQARLLSDEGVSLIVGHHPHVIQGIERHNNTIIAYSLGNFVFDVWQKRLRQTCILSIKLYKNRPPEFMRIPVMIERDYKPRILQGREANMVNAKYDKLDDKLKKYPYTIMPGYDAYNIYVKINEMRNKIENRALFIYNLPKYKPWVRKQSLWHFLEDRIK